MLLKSRLVAFIIIIALIAIFSYLFIKTPASQENSQGATQQPLSPGTVRAPDGTIFKEPLTGPPSGASTPAK